MGSGHFEHYITNLRELGVLKVRVFTSESCPTMSSFQELPLDILDPVISNLSDRKDWRACTLVNREFNRIATPLLYRSLDSRVATQNGKFVVLHPCFTLIQRPELGKYVRHVTESGSIHNRVTSSFTEQTLQALVHCTSLRSFTWTDDSDAGFVLYRFLEVIRDLPGPLEDIKIRSHLDVGQDTWDLLTTFSGLKSVSWFCMDGPPRVLQGWGERLGPTLTHLELGRCAGVPPSILVSVISQLPKLESILLKGAPASAVATILGILPNLRHLDTEYIPSGSSRSYNRSLGEAADDPRPPLTHLMVRTSSLDFQGPRMLWSWILANVPGPEPHLEVFRLHSFASAMTHIEVPRTFILGLARIHGSSLKQFSACGAQMTLTDIECLCGMFPQLEFIETSVWVEEGNMESLKFAIAKGKNLRALKLNVRSRFSTRDATNLMLRDEDSKLRFISVDGFQYTGKWYIVDDDLEEDELENRADYQVMHNSRGGRVVLRFIVTKTDSAEDLNW
ncbi:hypothetical protein CC1G_04640 [Coprinopsis cinerea okayama7|uniref:Uncharacterized protein n=1 Tax=Coprinopsis cinerea (strain Okayama-7 / 130 / ATCC MYA-4618 / FGSC 9003) TaxID=240176 RepID=A8N4V1_COPC7|nr:hypothetical protein CC1G_04640 [Coprinopsis cinerea okayama7\|eukprot:XP_001829951.2 hypothetical protein CC1G_04640 [Coprinopsis cinerea okayama7\